MSPRGSGDSALRRAIERHARTSFSRASGPGGQNVNKVSTQVELRMALSALPVSAHKRDLIRERLSTRITAADDLRVVARRERSQRRNRVRVLDRMVELITDAMAEDPRRMASRPTASALRRRRVEREKISARKRARRAPAESDD